MDAFAFTAANVTYSGDKYIIPLDLTLRNNGEVPAADFQVRFSDNGGWSETRAIASLDSGASTTLHLYWDITTLLDRGNGQATMWVMWNVRWRV